MLRIMHINTVIGATEILGQLQWRVKKVGIINYQEHIGQSWTFGQEVPQQEFVVLKNLRDIAEIIGLSEEHLRPESKQSM